ncbi:recombination-associated protein RdgC [Gammaproteobacteria bacterium]|nr:recombination-associated protein RdgC [Gammaproteobacteria bacterium]
MWFKQLKLFKVKDLNTRSIDNFKESLEKLSFKSCPPSMESSMGWVSPLDRIDGPLALKMNNCLIMCLQVEEKILPTTVINHELNQKIKKIELADDRKIRQKEKLSLKDETIITLLPKAFTKFIKFYAYIDLTTNYIFLNTNQNKRVDQFLSMIKKTIPDNIVDFDFKKVSPILTNWISNETYPKEFYIKKACLLQDTKYDKRVIRCREQNLFSSSIKALIKDGCEVKQLQISWNDRVDFILNADDCSFANISFNDDIKTEAHDMDSETIDEKFLAEFFIMSETIKKLVHDLEIFFSETIKFKESNLNIEAEESIL